MGALVLGASLLMTTPAQAAPGPVPGSAAYVARDVQNMEAAFGRNVAQFEDPAYLPDFFLNAASLFTSQLSTQLENPTRPSLTAGSLVPGFASGNPDRAGWNGTRGEDLPVTFTATDGAALHGDVFAPLPGARDPYTGALLTGPFPGAVIVTGSIQASRNEYAWLAEDLAERGYVVLTFDVQGQGQSETLPHLGSDPNLPSCGSLATGPGQVTPCPGVPAEQDQDFVDSTENAISFFLSTPVAPYPNIEAGSLAVNHYNPLWNLFDHSPDTQSATPGRTTRLGPHRSLDRGGDRDLPPRGRPPYRDGGGPGQADGHPGRHRRRPGRDRLAARAGGAQGACPGPPVRVRLRAPALLRGRLLLLRALS